MAALRTDRDRAMVQAMVLGGLRRGEVLGLRLGDLRLGEWRVFIAEGKGGHERLVPISPTFFATVARLHEQRATTRCPDRLGSSSRSRDPAGPAALSRGARRDLRAARERAGLTHGTCHELRHTCFTRLREAGMAIEAIQAQAGHRSITSTRVYLHLASTGWPRSTAGPSRPSSPGTGGGGPMSALAATRSTDPVAVGTPEVTWDEIHARAP